MHDTDEKSPIYMLFSISRFTLRCGMIARAVLRHGEKIDEILYSAAPLP